MGVARSSFTSSSLASCLKQGRLAPQGPRREASKAVIFSNYRDIGLGCAACSVPCSVWLRSTMYVCRSSAKFLLRNQKGYPSLFQRKRKRFRLLRGSRKQSTGPRHSFRLSLTLSRRVHSQTSGNAQATEASICCISLLPLLFMLSFLYSHHFVELVVYHRTTPRS